MNIAFLFPGQGAQYPGMGRDFHESSQAVREIFQEASDAAGFDIADITFNGPEERLNTTDVTQLAMTATSLAAAAVLADRGIYPDLCAGFSVGEYAALVAAGVISRSDVFPLVLERGRLTEAASRANDSDAGKAGMAAVMGLSFAEVSDICSGLSDVYPALHNSPVQTVIAGTAEGLSAAEGPLKEAGAKRFIPLKVSGPFHSPLLQSAADQFRAVLEGLSFADPRIPVMSNVTGEVVETGAEWKDLCVRQLVSPVQWVAVEHSILRQRPEILLECGAGTVLAGNWRALAKAEPAADACDVRAAGTLADAREFSAP